MEANEEQREYWNRAESSHWVEKQPRYDEMLGPFGDAVLERVAIESTDQVLDIGCGNGATTRDAARAAPSGRALGLDLSRAMVERARALARSEGVTNVEFAVDDAQTRSFEPTFDCAISRFGVMFFDDPVGAFANVRTALREGGRVTFAVWQELTANEWLAVPAAALLEHVTIPDLGEPGPGPFALADADHVRSILGAAGYSDVAIDPYVTKMLVGGRGTLDDSVAFLRNTGIARAILDEAPPDVEARALDAVRAVLAPHMTDEGLRLTGSAWLVSARA
jgi:SAM-dependent methyltransferase